MSESPVAAAQTATTPPDNDDRPLPRCVDEGTDDPSSSTVDAVSVKLVDDTEKKDKESLPKHPGFQCAQFSCEELVGWSKSRGRYAKLCKTHLEAHRKRCSRSAVRRRKINNEYREKARMYDVQSMNLSSAHEEIRRLQARLAECERELRRVASISNTF